MGSPTTISSPGYFGDAGFRKMTGAEYDHMVETGVLTSEGKFEFLEGYMVLKMPANPPDNYSVLRTTKLIDRAIPNGRTVRGQVGTHLTESRPEPGVSVAKGGAADYVARHPAPADLGLVIEVSDSSLLRDRVDKGRIYARDSIPVYWVVNLVDRRVEVFTDPTGPDVPAGSADADPLYCARTDYAPGATVPLVLDGVTVGTIPVNELLP